MLIRKLDYLKKSNHLRNNANRKDISRYQWKLFKGMIEYSYNKIPFYKKIFRNEGLHPSDFRKLADIKRIPVLTKNIIRENYNLLQNHNLKSSTIRNTSGSSGVPLKVAYDEKSYDYSEAIYFRSMLNSGVKPFYKGCYFWAKPYPQKKFYHRLGLINKNFIWTGSSTEDQIRQINKINPKYLYLFPSNLKLVLKNIHLLSSRINLKSIICTGEILDKRLKQRAENYFNCPVYDHYGTQELNRVAQSCSEGVFHVDDDAIFLEVDRNNEEVGPGEKGEVILTGLYNYKMPLLRYKVGDLATRDEPGRCKCGVNFSRIKKIEGRQDDIIRLKDKEISPRAITGKLDPFLFDDVIYNYRLIQNKRSEFLLYYIPGKNYEEKGISELVSALKKQLGRNIDLKTRSVKYLEKNLGGKHRFIKSKVS